LPAQTAALFSTALIRLTIGRKKPAEHRKKPVVIFDCNGVLVDSEPLATAVLSEEFNRAGFPVTPDIIARYFTGRRPAEMFAEVEIAAGRKLPSGFAATVAGATLRRFRAELRATKHAAQALSWLRGPKCVASSSSIDRIRLSLETTDLIGFFDPHLFSANDVRNGKPAPDLLLHAAGKMGVRPASCIVVEDSAVGVAAGVAAGMTAIGFAGGSRVNYRTADNLRAAGARLVITDMRSLKGAVNELRGW
jgi:HAD superfamily hydrolase (TIGR01509 family)